MKKLTISAQMVVLFLFVILFSVFAFSSIIFSRIKYIAEEEMYSRLITYSTLLNANDPIVDVEFRDMDVAFICIKDNKKFYSTDILNYLNETDFDKLLSQIKNENIKPIYTGKLRNYNKINVYYAITILDNGNTTSLVLTSNKYVTNVAKNTSLQLILIFFSILSLSVLAIAIWGNQFARRIRRIQNHILYLPKEGYQTVYTDDGLDEVGELSRSVESMRSEIRANEHIKQEMLQNISHDLKTPIAVIKSYAEAQQDGMVDEDSSKVIIAQAEILKNKVNRLLQYNSLEYLEKDREFEDVDMKEVVEEVIQGYRFQTDLIIELDLTEDIFFKGYRENYFTVVDNIIDNAKRYAKTKIKVVLKKDRLRIYNDGDPIDEQFIKNSFKPYEKGSKGEFGLGMSIVKKTIDFFGMDLIVKNEAIGVSFIITRKK